VTEAVANDLKVEGFSSYLNKYKGRVSLQVQTNHGPLFSSSIRTRPRMSRRSSEIKVIWFVFYTAI